MCPFYVFYPQTWKSYAYAICQAKPSDANRIVELQARTTCANGFKECPYYIMAMRNVQNHR